MLTLFLMTIIFWGVHKISLIVAKLLLLLLLLKSANIVGGIVHHTSVVRIIS